MTQEELKKRIENLEIRIKDGCAEDCEACKDKIYIRLKVSRLEQLYDDLYGE